MTTQALAPESLTSDEQFRRDHAARLTALTATRDEELQRLEGAATRAKAAHAKASTAAVEEFQAARLQRHYAVNAGVLAALRPRWAAFLDSHSIQDASLFAEECRTQDAITTRVVAKPLEKEIVVVACLEFAARHPEAQSLSRFANSECWIPVLGEGFGSLAMQAAAAARNQFDLVGQQTAFLKLEAGVARIATVPGFGRVSADDAEELWPIYAACLPADLHEQKFQAHIAAVKARDIARHIEEDALRVAACQGDKDARAKLAARGAGVLNAVLASADTILRFAGLRDRPAPERYL